MGLSPIRVLFVIICGLISWADALAADGLDYDTVGARATARAGAVVVSDDSGAAVFVNPGGIARRNQLRVRLGVTLHDADSSYNPEQDMSHTVGNRAGAHIAPHISVAAGLGRFVVALAYSERGAAVHTLPSPQDNQPPAEVQSLFPHRYAGIDMRYSHRSVGVGAALRANDWLAVGVAATWARITYREARHIWAGFAGRDPIGDASRDMRLILEGTDSFVLGATLGVLLAPAKLPIEAAASVRITNRATLHGMSRLQAAHSAEFPQAQNNAPTSRLRLAVPVTARLGLRYLGDRVGMEAAAELHTPRGRQPTWTISGLEAVDETTATGSLQSATALVGHKTHFALRASTDVEIASGFLWASVGYALRTAASRSSRFTSVHAPNTQHTVAIGVESLWNDVSLFIGYARTHVQSVRITTPERTAINPFDAGTFSVGSGTFDGGTDHFGLSAEWAWPP